MSETFDSMSNVQFDILRELGNIGAGNATTALSQMIQDRKIDMRVPNVELLLFKDLAEIVGGAETTVVGIFLSLEGEFKGSMLFMLECSAAHYLVNILMGQEDAAISNASDDFSEMELSAITEIGNIIGGAYLSSISTLTNISIISSVPYLTIDMAGAILSVPAIEFGKVGDRALLIESQFYENDQAISGYFILIPAMESYAQIMSSLGL